MTKETILVVDDEENIIELVKFNLEREGYQVITTGNGDEALELVRLENPHLIVLDIMLPGTDGLTVCRTLNSNPETKNIPVIMLSARVEEFDKVLGLEMGADDYMTKPFSPRELVARVKARLRRQAEYNADKSGISSNRLSIGGLTIDEDRFAVSVNEHKLELTPKEFELMRFLARHPGKVFTRDFLLEKIWGYDYTGDSRTVDVHVRHIRQKLERLPDCPQLIETVRGVGYRFKEAR